MIEKYISPTMTEDYIMNLIYNWVKDDVRYTNLNKTMVEWRITESRARTILMNLIIDGRFVRYRIGREIRYTLPEYLESGGNVNGLR